MYQHRSQIRPMPTIIQLDDMSTSNEDPANQGSSNNEDQPPAAHRYDEAWGGFFNTKVGIDKGQVYLIPLDGQTQNPTTGVDPIALIDQQGPYIKEAIDDRLYQVIPEMLQQAYEHGFQTAQALRIQYEDGDDDDVDIDNKPSPSKPSPNVNIPASIFGSAVASPFKVKEEPRDDEDHTNTSTTTGSGTTSGPPAPANVDTGSLKRPSDTKDTTQKKTKTTNDDDTITLEGVVITKPRMRKDFVGETIPGHNRNNTNLPIAHLKLFDDELNKLESRIIDQLKRTKLTPKIDVINPTLRVQLFHTYFSMAVTGSRKIQRDNDAKGKFLYELAVVFMYEHRVDPVFIAAYLPVCKTMINKRLGSNVRYQN